MEFFPYHEGQRRTLRLEIHQELFGNPDYLWDFGSLTDFEKGRLDSLELAWEMLDTELRYIYGIKKVFQIKTLKTRMLELCMSKMDTGKSSEYKSGFTEALQGI